MAKVALRGIRRRSQDFESLWLITFADLMVQLMAFFAVIYSFSAQDVRKLDQLLASFRKAVHVDAAKAPPAPTGLGQGILPGHAGLLPDSAADLEKLLSELPAVEGREAGTRLRVVGFRGSLLFEEGNDVVDPVFQNVLAHLSRLIAQYPGFSLVCEGHAAPGEKGRDGTDAWALSGRRAQACVRALQALGADPRWLAAEARGDAQPDGRTDSPEGRALQRRVLFRFQRPAER